MNRYAVRLWAYVFHVSAVAFGGVGALFSGASQEVVTLVGMWLALPMVLCLFGAISLSSVAIFASLRERRLEWGLAILLLLIVSSWALWFWSRGSRSR